MPDEHDERDREREREEALTEERDREERDREREREGLRREDRYAGSRFDWVSFLLGLLLGLALLAVLWFFTGSQRIGQGQAPQQVVYASRTWAAEGEARTIDDSEFVRVDAADGYPIYVRRSQSQPYTIIYIREGDNTYQPYQPVTSPPIQEPDGGTTTPTTQEPTTPTPQELAQQRADKLTKQVVINGRTWAKQNLVSGENLDLERYGTYTVGGFNVYKEVQTPENMLNDIYAGVGSGMYVHYRKAAV